MRPYFALKILHFKVTTLLHFTTQYVKELLYTTLRLYTLLISAKETILNTYNTLKEKNSSLSLVVERML